MTTTTRYRVDAFAASGRRIASETIEADASDTALHEMAERHPRAARFQATPVGGDPGHSGCAGYKPDHDHELAF